MGLLCDGGVFGFLLKHAQQLIVALSTSGLEAKLALFISPLFFLSRDSCGCSRDVQKMSEFLPCSLLLGFKVPTSGNFRFSKHRCVEICSSCSTAILFVSSCSATTSFSSYFLSRNEANRRISAQLVVLSLMLITSAILAVSSCGGLVLMKAQF